MLYIAIIVISVSVSVIPLLSFVVGVMLVLCWVSSCQINHLLTKLERLPSL